MGANDWIMPVALLGIGAYVLTQTDILSQLQGGGAPTEPPPEEAPPAEGEGEGEEKKPAEGEEGYGEEGGEMGPGGVMVEHGEGYGDDDEGPYGKFDPGFMDPNRREYRDLCLSKRGCVWLSAPGRGNSFCSCNPNEHRRLRKQMGQSQCFRLGGFWNGRYCTYYVPFPYGGGPAPVFPRPAPYPRPRPGYPWWAWHPYPTAPPWWYDPRAPDWWRGPWPYRPGYRYRDFRPPRGWRYRPRGPYPIPRPRPGYPAPYPRPRPGPYPPGGAGRVCTPYRPGNPEWIAGKGGKCCEQRRSLGRWERVCWEYGRSISLPDAHRTPSSIAKPNGCIGCPPPPHPPSPNIYPGSSAGDPGREDRGDAPNVAPESTPGAAWGMYY